jgi:Phage integrase family
MRHTCASLLLAQRVPPRIVIEILGHSQRSMTMDTYSHVMPTAQTEVAGAVQRALEGHEARIAVLQYKRFEGLDFDGPSGL